MQQGFRPAGQPLTTRCSQANCCCRRNRHVGRVLKDGPDATSRASRWTKASRQRSNSEASEHSCNSSSRRSPAGCHCEGEATAALIRSRSKPSRPQPIDARCDQGRHSPPGRDSGCWTQHIHRPKPQAGNQSPRSRRGRASTPLSRRGTRWSHWTDPPGHPPSPSGPPPGLPVATPAPVVSAHRAALAGLHQHHRSTLADRTVATIEPGLARAFGTRSSGLRELCCPNSPSVAADGQHRNTWRQVKAVLAAVGVVCNPTAFELLDQTGTSKPQLTTQRTLESGSSRRRQSSR